MADEEPVNPHESETKAELQEELAARDLPTSGNKSDLIARLEDADVPEEDDAPVVTPLVAHGGGNAASQVYVGPQTMHTKELPRNLTAFDQAKIPPGKATGSTVNDWSKSPGGDWPLQMLPDITPSVRQATSP